MSPKTSQQNEDIRQLSRTKILDAAFGLIARNGYESTSISQIAKEAGVSKGLIYNYYESKEELLITLVNKVMDEGGALFSEIDMNKPKEALMMIFNWFFDDLTARPEYWKLLTEMMFKVENFDFVHTIFTNKINEYILLLEQLLKGIGIPNAKEEARLLGALFDGIGVHYLVMREDYPIASMKKYVIDKYCD